MSPSIYVFLFLCMTAVVRSQQANCKNVGPLCSDDGNSIHFCKKKGVASVEVEPCEGGKKCREKNGSVTCIDPNSVDVTFECTGKGEFPDTKDCSRTYICKEGSLIPSEVCTCLSGNVYPAEGLYCVPGECPRNTIVCQAGLNGHFTLKGNDKKTSFYYYCESSEVVKVFGNVDGSDSVAEVFRARTNGKKCVPYRKSDPTSPSTQPTQSSPIESTTSPSTQPTQSSPTESTTSPSTQPTQSSPTESTTSPSTEPTPSAPTPPECRHPGEIHPSECDCDYYQCDKTNKPRRRTCPDGLRFLEKYKRCVFGECDESKCIRPNFR